MQGKTVVCAAILLTWIARAAPAQEALDRSSFRRITPVKHLTYDYAKQRVVRHGAPDKRFIATFCYVNTDTVGFFTSTSVGTEYIDWGVLGGTATTQCAGLSDIVSNFNFAYASSSIDTSVAGPGASLTLTFYTNWTGFGADSGNCPVATFAFTGLPGFSGSSTGIGSAYGFTVDLSGGFEFCMPDGRFGYGYRGDGNTGPLLCLTGDGAGGREPATGNSDVFDIWAPDTKGVNVGSFFFGGPPNNFSSWYGQVARADLSGSPASVVMRNATGGTNPPNSLICCPAPLGGTLNVTIICPPGYLLAFLFAFDTAFELPLAGGQRLLCLDLGGSGELLGGPAATAIGGGVFTFTGPVPKNLDLCGFAFCMQAICAFGVTPFALTSACDFVVGEEPAEVLIAELEDNSPSAQNLSATFQCSESGLKCGKIQCETGVGTMVFTTVASTTPQDCPKDAKTLETTCAFVVGQKYRAVTECCCGSISTRVYQWDGSNLVLLPNN